ncbi:MAG: hypothetical protein P1U68_07555 [Verrucomicrobiales bacterium]|nr:hypothetical protein [Verrucomicrobiales bacterium]
MKEAWHTWLLIAVGLIAGAISGLMAFKAMGFSEQFVLVPGSPNDELPATDEARAGLARQFVESTQEWKTPVTGSPPKSVPLFVSVPIVEIDGKLIDMGNPNDEMIRPPVSNAWLLTNNLDFLNSGVLSQDPDSDGFSNIAEWHAKTAPNDSTSHPPYAEKLVMHSRQQQEYTLRFSARPDSERFQIMKLPTAKYPGRDNFYMKVGETSKDEQFRLESFEEKTAKNNVGIEADATELIVTYLPDGKTYKLVRNEDKVIPTYFAEMEFLLDPGNRFYVKEGDAFNIVIDPETKYRVVKVNEDSATVTYQTGIEPEQTIEIKKK